jgi:hypothetical protein
MKSMRWTGVVMGVRLLREAKIGRLRFGLIEVDVLIIFWFDL